MSPKTKIEFIYNVTPAHLKACPQSARTSRFLLFMNADTTNEWLTLLNVHFCMGSRETMDSGDKTSHNTFETIDWRYETIIEQEDNSVTTRQEPLKRFKTRIVPAGVHCCRNEGREVDQIRSNSVQKAIVIVRKLKIVELTACGRNKIQVPLNQIMFYQRLPLHHLSKLIIEN